MTTSKIILGSAAAFVTLATGLAVKASRNGHHRMFGVTKVNFKVCKVCASLFSQPMNGVRVATCNTKIGGGGITLKAHGSNLSWATRTSGAGGSVKTCTAFPRTLVTKIS